MSEWESIDYFSDQTVVADPYPYFEQLRAENPVLRMPHQGVVAVSGYDAVSEVYKQGGNFSSACSLVGPLMPFPVPFEGDDISAIIAEHRHTMPMFDHMVTMDGDEHERERALLMRIITPKRLKENEDFVWRLADQQLDVALKDGRCEFVTKYSQPFALIVVADLLGVPEGDHEKFREGFGYATNPGSTDGSVTEGNSLTWLDDYFAQYIEDRRKEPRQDALTEMAQATYPDGEIPPVPNVVRTATFLFAAGQETTARLLGSALLYLAENPEAQDYLRAHRDKIPNFIEEILRTESPVKTDFRLAVRNTTVGGVDIKAGDYVMLLNGAANRDPAQFTDPDEVRIDRENTRNHIAFGRGIHFCPGAPLARVEGRVSLERILDRTRNIRLSEEHHGPAGARTLSWEPTWILRGLTELHLEFDLA